MATTASPYIAGTHKQFLYTGKEGSARMIEGAAYHGEIKGCIHFVYDPALETDSDVTPGPTRGKVQCEAAREALNSHKGDFRYFFYEGILQPAKEKGEKPLFTIEFAVTRLLNNPYEPLFAILEKAGLAESGAWLLVPSPSPASLSRSRGA